MLPGYCPVGELVFIWERGVRRNDRCGCGERFADCPFWDQVGKAAFGGWDQADASQAVRLRRAVDRHRNLDRLAGLRRPGGLEPEIAEYAALTDRLYQAVREVSGACVIVDSSKHVGYALLLRRLPSVDLRLVHLVRRSHAVAYSWSRRVTKPGVGDGTQYMSVHSPSWAVGLWLADNLLYDALGRRTPHASRVRYEDLIADPAAEIGRVIGELGLPAGQALDFLAEPAVELPASHALGGNPMRFQRGKVELRTDDEWRTAMSRPRRVAISAVTWPMLLRYGYPIATRPQRRS
jgi:Sulfotransferase domain